MANEKTPKARRPGRRHCPVRTSGRAGFTLLELLAVVTIIGLIASIGTVSYDSARGSARDVKRLADTKQIQIALELFYNNNGYYPGDKTPGPAGLVVGSGEAQVLSDGGFDDRQSGNVYISRLPINPEPSGLPYTYRALDGEGGDCSGRQCRNYALIFFLERDSAGLSSGPHAITPIGVVGPGSPALAGVMENGRIVGLDTVAGSTELLADTLTDTMAGFIEDKRVKTAAEKAVAPAATAAAVANTAVAVNAAAGTASAGPYILFFLTQPLALFRRGRRKYWGTVYNSLSKMPEDLAIIRLIEHKTGRLLRTEVTDRDGRFSFLMPEGHYRMLCVKNGFIFPSKVLAGQTEDGQLLDIYHGEDIKVGPEGSSLTPNIPIDPIDAEVDDEKLIKNDRMKRLKSNIALVSPALGAVSLAIKPTWLTLLLFILQVAVYLLFRRIAMPPRPKNWGTVYEDGTGKPVYQAVVRVFALPYHKLVASFVTDRAGRYNSKVGSAKYYMTVSHKGYLKTETEPIDFSGADRPMFLAADLPLRSESYIVAKSKPKKASLPDSGAIQEAIIKPIATPSPNQAAGEGSKDVVEVLPEGETPIQEPIPPKEEPVDPNAAREAAQVIDSGNESTAEFIRTESGDLYVQTEEDANPVPVVEVDQDMEEVAESAEDLLKNDQVASKEGNGEANGVTDILIDAPPTEPETKNDERGRSA